MKPWKRITAGILCALLFLQAIPGQMSAAEMTVTEEEKPKVKVQQEEVPEAGIAEETENENGNISETDTSEEVENENGNIPEMSTSEETENENGNVPEMSTSEVTENPGAEITGTEKELPEQDVTPPEVTVNGQQAAQGQMVKIYVNKDNEYQLSITAADVQTGVKSVEITDDAQSDYAKILKKEAVLAAENGWSYSGKTAEGRNCFLWVFDNSGNYVRIEIQIVADHKAPDADISSVAVNGVGCVKEKTTEYWGTAQEGACLEVDVRDENEPITASFGIYRKSLLGWEKTAAVSGSDMVLADTDGNGKKEIPLPAEQINGLENGSYKLEAVFRDDAGNETSVIELCQFKKEMTRLQIGMNGSEETQIPGYYRIAEGEKIPFLVTDQGAALDFTKLSGKLVIGFEDLKGLSVKEITLNGVSISREKCYDDWNHELTLEEKDWKSAGAKAKLEFQVEYADSFCIAYQDGTFRTPVGNLLNPVRFGTVTCVDGNLTVAGAGSYFAKAFVGEEEAAPEASRIIVSETNGKERIERITFEPPQGEGILRVEMHTDTEKPSAAIVKKDPKNHTQEIEEAFEEGKEIKYYIESAGKYEIRIKAKDSGSGVKKAEYSTEAGEYENVMLYPLEKQGDTWCYSNNGMESVRTLYIWISDYYGNRLSAKINIIEDNTPPVIDVGAGIRAEGGTMVDDIYGKHWWGAAEERSLLFHASDASEPIGAVYRIYRIAEDGSETLEGEEHETQLTVEGACTDPALPEGKYYRMKLESGLFGELGEDDPDTERLLDGDYRLSVKFYDDAGNDTDFYEDFYRFTLDRSNPQITIQGEKEFWLQPSEYAQTEVEIRTRLSSQKIEYAITTEVPREEESWENVSWVQIPQEDIQLEEKKGSRVKVNLTLPQEEHVSERTEGSQAYYLCVRDELGHKICASEPLICHTDGKAPKLTDLEIKKEGGLKRLLRSILGIFLKEDETLTLKVKAEDKPQEGAVYTSAPQVTAVELYYLCADSGEEGKELTYEELEAAKEQVQRIKAEDVLDSDQDGRKILQFKLDVKEHNQFYRLYFVATDKAGNRTIRNLAALSGDGKEDIVMVDDKKPVINSELKEGSKVPDYEETRGKKTFRWYAKAHAVNYGFQVQDQESGIFSAGISINGKKITEDADGIAFYDAGQAEDDSLALEHGFSYCISPGQGKIGKDGSYKLEFFAEDNAGNTSKKSDIIYVDQDVPVITEMEFDTGETDQLSTVPVQYGYFFQKETAVTVYATDDIKGTKNIGSGVAYVNYQLIPADGTPIVNGQAAAVDKEKGIYTAKFRIPEGFKGQIQVTATDHVGQSSPAYDPRGAVVETPKEHEKTSSAEITLPKTTCKDSEGNPLYKEDITIGLAVSDSRSGLKQTSWSVKEHNSAENLSGGVLDITSVYQEENGTWNSQLSGDSGWQIPDELELNLVTRAQKQTAVTADSNHITAQLAITDHAGNSSEASAKTFSIDKAAPKIQVGYDDRETANGTYFKEKRTATVTVTDANFSPEECEFVTTGPTCGISEWKHRAGKGCDGKVHTRDCSYSCQVTFAEDGDYTFTFRCRDLAGNEAVYGRVDEFTVDTVKPVIQVNYDNNAVKNGHYYNKGRTATLQVEDKNFDGANTQVAVTAARDGVQMAAPAVSAFTQNGDIWTATVDFTEDGDYTLQVTTADKAGNPGEAYKSESFTIDQTKPELSIEGVAQNSANQGVVAPIIQGADSNLDGASVSVSLQGANHGKVAFDSKTQQTDKQIEIAMRDFKHAAEIDDLYTLEVSIADKAGNEKQETRVFSVNRFGSVYILGERTGQLVDQFYTNQEQELVITEVNVDTLQFEEIVYSLDGNIVTLEKGRDYEVKSDTNEADWKMYEYRIHARNFAQEGSYVVSIYSEDLAQNKSSNKAKGKEIAFVVDKTAPSIVVAGVENSGQYVDAKRNITVDAQDNILLDQVTVYADDDRKASAAREELMEQDGQVKLSLTGSNQMQSLWVEARDAAGNVTRTPDIRFLITKNLLIQWVNNVPLFAGTVSTTAAAGAAGAFIFRRRKLRLNA